MEDRGEPLANGCLVVAVDDDGRIDAQAPGEDESVRVGRPVRVTCAAPNCFAASAPARPRVPAPAMRTYQMPLASGLWNAAARRSTEESSGTTVAVGARYRWVPYPPHSRGGVSGCIRP